MHQRDSGTVWVLTVALGVLVWSRAPLAQEREPLRQATAIPTDLASALIAAGGFGMSGDPQILVGELPEWVVSRVHLPRGAHVLGSAFFGSTVVGVVNVPAVGDSVLVALQRELLERGWKRPPLPPNTGGGFRPATSPGSPMPSERPTLCRDQHVLSMWMSRQQAATTTIIMRLGSTGASMCNPPRVSMQRRPSPFPILYNPAGSDADPMSSRQCYTNFVSSGTQTRLKTPLTGEAILEHYGKQLQDSGWTRAGVPPVLGRTWTRKDSTGAPQVLRLTVQAAPHDTTCRTVELDVQGMREP